MKWASSLSEKPRLEDAVAECAASIKKQMERVPTDLVIAFISTEFSDRYGDLNELLFKHISAKAFLGCSGGGVIGAGHEVEQKPALSLVAASMPHVELKPFSIQDDELPDMDASPRAWEDLVGVKSADNPQFIVLADPFSVRADSFIMGLDYAFPRSTKVGGLASGASGPNENALYVNDLSLNSGLVGLAMVGNVEVDAIVAQGCKPIGEPLQVTDCEQNILMGLNHKTPLEILQDMVDKLSDQDRELIRHSLFLGLLMDPSRERHERGDFLVRNIVGVDKEKGFLAIGALLRTGQTVQFHLRDAQTSAEDLRHMLTRFSAKKNKAKGALLFSCLGRGAYLYGVPDHDIQLFRQNVGAIPVGGFFCNGEIGPIDGTTYLHGYTSCFGLFRPKS